LGRHIPLIFNEKITKNSTCDFPAIHEKRAFKMEK